MTQPDDYMKKYRDRLRVTVLLHIFSEPVKNDPDICAVFRTEVKIQALDFLLRYPDFFSLELLDLFASGGLDPGEVRGTVLNIFTTNEPVLRVEEMEKFFHGAYESIDETVAFLTSISFIRYESKKRRDGKEYEKLYYFTHFGSNKIKESLIQIASVKWYVDRCLLIKKYFGHFSGSELKRRQYKYVEEYASVPYKSKIRQVQLKVRNAYQSHFNQTLP